MSLTKVSYSMIEGAPANALDYPTLQEFFDASKGRSGYIPAGEYTVSTTLVLDPEETYDIFGDGYDIEGNTGTIINYTGTGQCINIQNTSPPTIQDKFIRLARFALVGTQAASDGLFAAEVAGLRTDQLLIRDFGGNGMNLFRLYNSQHSSNVITACGQSGIRLSEQGNNVVFDRCIVNGNSRLDGYSNIALTAQLGKENLGVTLIGCDFTGAGLDPYTTVTTAYGLSMTYSQSVNVIGCYAEGNKTANIYADNTNKNVNVTGNYFQDANNVFINIDNLVVEGNTFFRNTTATTLSITGQANNIRRGLRIGRNTYIGGATRSFTQFARERQEQYGTSSPIGGTYEQGDIVWRFNPDYPYNVGWVCSAAGTPGTWVPFAQILAVFSDQGDASVVLENFASYTTNMWRTALTANRTVTFSTTNAVTGAKFRITRAASSTGAFNLNVVHVDGTKALATGQWCDVEFDGTAWFLTASGSL